MANSVEEEGALGWLFNKIVPRGFPYEIGEKVVTRDGKMGVVTGKRHGEILIVKPASPTELAMNLRPENVRSADTIQGRLIVDRNDFRLVRRRAPIVNETLLPYRKASIRE